MPKASAAGDAATRACGEAGVAPGLEGVEPVARLAGGGERAGLPARAPFGRARARRARPRARGAGRAGRGRRGRVDARRTARGSPRPRGRAGRARRRGARRRVGRAGQRRRRPVSLGVGEHVVGEGHHGVARLGQPGVLHDDAHLEVAAVVDDAVDDPGLEPHERAGLERMLREARPVDGLQPPAARDHDVGLGRDGVQVRRAARRARRARAPPYTSSALTEVAPGNAGASPRSSRTQQLGQRGAAPAAASAGRTLGVARAVGDHDAVAQHERVAGGDRRAPR